MKVSISVTDRRFKLDKRHILSFVGQVLRDQNAGDRMIDIIYCRDKDIIPLNLKFKGENRSTDVLAFDLSEGRYLGEIYVNLEIAHRQAIENRVPYKQEVDRLTIHGVLHLLGFRDNTPGKKAKMWSCQEGYLK